MSSQLGRAIVIADYDPEWPSRFERERDLIVAACRPNSFVGFEHMGSTSIPGLAAKPVIDMMPGLRSLADAPPLIAAMETLGYEYVPEFEHDSAVGPGMPDRRYLRKNVNGVRAFHAHMVVVGSDMWRDDLLFRDYLRLFPDVAADYERLKRRLAAEYNATLTPQSDINTGYTDYKTEFVESVKAKARTLAAEGRLPPRL